MDKAIKDHARAEALRKQLSAAAHFNWHHAHPSESYAPAHVVAHVEDDVQKQLARERVFEARRALGLFAPKTGGKPRRRSSSKKSAKKPKSRSAASRKSAKKPRRKSLKRKSLKRK